MKKLVHILFHILLQKKINTCQQRQLKESQSTELKLIYKKKNYNFIENNANLIQKHSKISPPRKTKRETLRLKTVAARNV